MKRFGDFLQKLTARLPFKKKPAKPSQEYGSATVSAQSVQDPQRSKFKNKRRSKTGLTRGAFGNGPKFPPGYTAEWKI